MLSNGIILPYSALPSNEDISVNCAIGFLPIISFQSVLHMSWTLKYHKWSKNLDLIQGIIPYFNSLFRSAFLFLLWMYITTAVNRQTIFSITSTCILSSSIEPSAFAIYVGFIINLCNSRVLPYFIPSHNISSYSSGNFWCYYWSTGGKVLDFISDKSSVHLSIIRDTAGAVDISGTIVAIIFRDSLTMIAGPTI